MPLKECYEEYYEWTEEKYALSTSTKIKEPFYQMLFFKAATLIDLQMFFPEKIQKKFHNK